ncbi:MAG TPA: TVP38/TMEM64 family protein [Mycobacterium sp.]|uniref:TVP38/TMEM64 family protein n=1 Tax=Mycolicibacterium sp. TaxID=2320850 RepID=UPI0025E38F17|nr:TVP38/TMEM64 family protein [Mycolicibacterium sp.]HPX37624.1 TVP38/TMEM64 family protein [Mycobacterium sp.]HQC76317.1 TVP38/TMEM64 family protein [Mycobacterium sp.]
MPPAFTSKIGATARNVASALTSTARQVSRTRLILTMVAVAAVVAIVLLVPVPSAVQLRDWATAAGPWFPLAFFATHVAVTVLPFPRTAFTLAAGLLFGPALGIAIAVTASALSALLALFAVRALGWQLSSLVSHPALESVDARLRERGWAAVLSLRLIPVVPFSVLNYAAGASSVRVVPYLLATLVGVLPGTAAVVVLGDALTGEVSPLLALVSLATASVGVAGLAYEARQHRRGR